MKTSRFLIALLICVSILKSQTWEQSSLNEVIYDFYFFNADVGLALTSGPTAVYPNKIYKTTNKGTSWFEIKNFENNKYQDANMSFINATTGYARFGHGTFDEFLPAEDRIYKTTDAGNSWSQVATNPVRPAGAEVFFVSDGVGFEWYRDTRNIRKTVDNGQTWNSVYQVTSSGNITDVRKSAADPTNVIYISSLNNSAKPYLTKYTISSSSGVVVLDGQYDPEDIRDITRISVINNNGDVIKLACNNGIGQYSGSTLSKLGNTPVTSSFVNFEFSNNSFGLIGNGQSLHATTNGGASWTQEYGSHAGFYADYAVIGNVAYTQTSGYTGVLTRKLGMSMNTNFDWRNNGYSGSFKIDGTTFNTPSSNQYIRGGTCLLQANTNEYVISGSDTTARFYYWGGYASGSMNFGGASAYIIYNGEVNADYKTKLVSTTSDAIRNGNQVKVLKDTNGVTNVVYESMGGIFFTRTKPDGNFKIDEVLSGTYGSSQYGNVTYNNSNPYLTEFKPYQNTAANPPEKNVWACWERREGNNIKILVAARSVDPLNRPEWFVQEYATIENAPADFKCFPKIMVAGNLIYNTRVLTYLKPVSGSSRKLVGKIFYNSNPNIQERDIIPAANIQEYAIAPITNNGLDGSTVFNVHLTYRTVEPNSQQPVFYKHVKIGWDELIQGPFYYEVPNTFTSISNEISRWRASLDIALKNASDNTNSYSMQPVVTYQGRYDVRIIIQNEDGPPQEVPGSYYPVYVRERLTSGGWSSSSILYNSLNNVQQTPNIEGSKQRNSCLLNYTRIEGGSNKNLQVVPRWNNSTPNAYFCVPNNFTGTDAKIQKGALVNASSTSQKLMTLSQSASVYNIGAQNFNITNEQSTNDGGSFEAISGTVTDDEVKYSFNLGNIMVNWNLIGFSSDIDTTIEDTPEFNQNLKSKTFLLNDNDTLVIGRNAFYILESGDGEPLEIEYKVKLISKTTETMHKLLAQDTIHAGDTIQVEYLEGFIIANIPNGTDSFYVQMEIDTLDGSYGIGGGSGDGDGGDGGDSPINGNIKRKIFWENEKQVMKTSTIPTKFNLYQNFPNPFNPITKIKYDLPRNSNVTITIYDLLGREVTRLVNNELRNAGRYEIEWNANKYASGAYIYRIEAGDFVDTKKMILIK